MHHARAWPSQYEKQTCRRPASCTRTARIAFFTASCCGFVSLSNFADDARAEQAKPYVRSNNSAVRSSGMSSIKSCPQGNSACHPYGRFELDMEARLPID
jgi:hypothetical protein